MAEKVGRGIWAWVAGDFLGMASLLTYADNTTMEDLPDKLPSLYHPVSRPEFRQSFLHSIMQHAFVSIHDN